VRVRVISQNIANADSLATNPGEQPYRRHTVSFRSELNRALGTETVKLHEIGIDKSAFGSRLDPGHPAADENGYVRLPNVKRMIEMDDLLITDAVMPEMDGPTLIKNVRDTMPDMPVICISGYAEETFRNRLGEDTDIHFLPKPFSLAQLAGKVKEVMDRVAH
jgi:CheY-like chemotaxis protein